MGSDEQPAEGAPNPLPEDVARILPAMRLANGGLFLRGGERLNPREMAVWRLVHAGLSNVEIARELDLSEAAVRYRIRSLREKTGCNRIRLAVVFEYLEPLS